MADEIKNKTENDEIEEVTDNIAEAEEKADDLLEDDEISDIETDEDNEDEEDDDDNDDDEADVKSAEKEKNIIGDILEIIESTLVTVFVIIMLFTYLLHPVNVVGGSMNDTLFSKDRIFMTTVYTGPHYGDIIVINNDMAYLLGESGNIIERDITGSGLKECIIKRVIAEPGQTLDINAELGQVIVDGKILDEPYIKDTVNFDGGVFDFPITIPDGYYFVMGDNRRGSSDSRYADVGLIKKEQIYGKALLRYTPNFKFLIFK